MRLRGRFTLWFALAALVPIAVAAVVTREVVSRSFTDSFEADRKSTMDNLRRELEDLESSVADVVADMVDGDPKSQHPLVDGVLLELNKSGQLPAETRMQIKIDSLRYKRGLGLDVLFVIGTDDEVLAAPHYRPARDTIDPVPGQRARERRGKPYYVRELTMPGDRIEPLLVVESAREYRQGGHRVVIVGGREVEEELLESIRQPGRIDARMVDGHGRILAKEREGPGVWNAPSAVKFSESLVGPDGEPTAIIEIVMSRAGLDSLLGQVTINALVLAGAALLVTILLGFLIARRITANLDRLVSGVQAAARGDLDHRVEIKTRDEIGALAASFNAMMEDLKTSKERLVIAERVAAWQEIARRLAHEIKNPLTPIQMSVETMRKTWRKKHPSFDEIFEESTATVLEETARLKRIVAEFSEFARLPKPSLMPCNLSEAVASCLALYEGSIPITRKLGTGLPSIEADRDQLSQVLLNLLENARDALESRPRAASDAGSDAGQGRIVVETRMSERGDRLELVVEDSGPGLPDHVKEKLFTPYFTTKAGGTGLGLAIVHRMVSDHGGRIIAGDSSLGGARFIVQFPLGEALKEGTIDLELSAIWRSLH